MRRRALVAALAGLTVAAGCGGSSSGDADDPTVAATATATTTPSGGCTDAAPTTNQLQQFPKEPPLTVDPTTYTATVKTNCGTIVIEMDAKATPHTVNSFAFLAGKHYFDDTPCHRLTTSGIYVLQCGDPTGTGGGDPGYSIPDENLKGAKYPPGTVAMANAGPNTGGSQFFFVYHREDTPPGPLDPNYTPFGTVVQGLDVLKAIAKEGSNPPGDGAPVQPVVIESFTVEKSG